MKKEFAVTVNGKEITDRLTMPEAEAVFNKLSMRRKNIAIINVFSKRIIVSLTK